jgi:alpha-1,6-mannosyltransferase
MAGLAATVGWSCLAWLSRGPKEVPLAVLLAVLAVAWAATLAGFRLLRRQSGACFRRQVIFWAVVFRGIGLLGQPLLEDDPYRYLWDAWVFARTGTPYGPAPEQFFADPEVPEEFRTVLDGVNHPDLPTIYGPLCQYLFLVAYWIRPAETLPIRLMAAVAELAGILLIGRFVTPAGQLLYAWCPLLVQETAFTGHPDAVGVALLLAAMAARRSGRPNLCASAAALAVAARIHALPLVPFLVAAPRLRVRSAAVFAGVLGLLYLPFLLKGGGETGLLSFAADWEFNSFGYGLLGLVLPPAATRPAALGLAAAGLGWLFLRRRLAEPLPGELVTGWTLLWSPVINPWYLLWLAPFVAIRPSAWGIAALAAVPLSYVHGLHLPKSGLPPYHHPSWLRPVEWGAVLVFAIASALKNLHRNPAWTGGPDRVPNQRSDL